MKRVLPLIIVFVLLLTSACTRADEEQTAVNLDGNTQTVLPNDNTDNKNAQTPDTNSNKNNQQQIENSTQKEDNKTDGDNSESQENESENKVETPKEEDKKPVYDDSDATPVSSFKYKKYSDKNEIYITGFIGSEKNVVIPNYIEGYPVTYVSWFRTYIPKDETEKDDFTDTSMIETLTIPETVRALAPNCLCGENLKTIIVKSENVTVWGWAFDRCPVLESVTFMGNTSVESIIFSQHCPKLKEVIFLKDAPKKLVDGNFLMHTFNHPEAVIKYKKGTKGWDDPIWKDFKLEEIE